MSPSDKVDIKPRHWFTRSLGWLINKLWFVSATLIIFAAVVHILLGLLLPYLNYLKPQIVDWIENQYHVELEVESIRGEWSTKGPNITLIGVTVVSQSPTDSSAGKESASSSGNRTGNRTENKTRNQTSTSDEKEVKQSINLDKGLLEIGAVSVYLDLFKTLVEKEVSTQKILLSKARLKFIIDQNLGVRFSTNATTRASEQNIDKSRTESGALTGEENDSSNIKNSDPVANEPMSVQNVSKIVLDTLGAQKNILIKDSSLVLQTLTGKTFNYHIANLTVDRFQLANSNIVHQLDGTLDDGGLGTIWMLAELEKDQVDPSNSRSNIYLQADDVDLTTLPWFENWQPKSGDLSWQVWATWKNEHWVSMDSQFDLYDTDWTHAKDNELTKPVDENKLTSFISWRSFSNKNGSLSVHDTKIKKANELEQTLSDIRFNFQYQDPENLSWRVSMKNFDVSPVLDYAGNVFASQGGIFDFFENAEPQLSLDSFETIISKNRGQWQSPEVRANFSNLGFTPFGSVPGVKEIAGEVSYSQKNLSISLNAANTALSFDSLFRDDIPADNLSLALGLDLSWPHLKLDIQDFHLTNNDLELRAKGAFIALPDAPQLNLYTEITHANVAEKSRYLPVGVMSSDLVEYLDNGVKSGQMTMIQSLVRGPLKDFPYANHNGVFIAYGELENALFEYLPDWPEAERLDAHLLFSGNSMDITSSSAVSRKNRLNFARARIADMSLPTPKLALNLDVTSTDNTGRDFLKRSPLTSVGKALEQLDFQGQIQTLIDLDVDLDDKGEVKLTGYSKPSKTGSKLNIDGLLVSELDGEIRYTHQGIAKSQIKANYLERQLDISLWGASTSANENGITAGAQAKPVLTMDIQGEFDEHLIQEYLGPSWTSFFKGRSDFSALVEVLGEGAPENNTTEQPFVHVIFQSDFEGMSVALPDEFHKLADERAPLNLDLLLGKRSLGNAQWKGMQGRWFWQSEDADDEGSVKNSAQINLESAGETSASAPNNQETNNHLTSVEYGAEVFINQTANYSSQIGSGIDIYGQVEKANLANWLKFIGKISQPTTATEENKTQEHLKKTVKPKPTLALNIDQFEIAQLDAEIAFMENVELSMNAVSERVWHINGLSDNGSFAIEQSIGEPTKIEIENLVLDLKDDLATVPNEKTAANKGIKERSKKTPESSEPLAIASSQVAHSNSPMVENKSQKSRLDSMLMPSDFVPMDIDCKNCTIDRKLFGDIKIETRQLGGDSKSKGDAKADTNGISFKIYSSKEKHHQLSLFGTWQNTFSEKKLSEKRRSEKQLSEKSLAEKPLLAVSNENKQLSKEKASTVPETKTALWFDLTTADSGALLKEWSLELGVEESKGRLHGFAEWDNAPWDIQLASMHADARINLGKGYLSEVSDGAGRLFSLFNLQSLIRKLTFDFKDVYKKGFFYDSLDGTVTLRDGILSSEDVAIKGNVADVKLYGSTDFNQETTDQYAIVSPHLTSSLPVLAAWAVEPTTGVLIYVLEKLMSPAIEVVTRVDYRLHGSFDDIAVEKISSAKKKIQVEQDVNEEQKPIEKQKEKQNEIEEQKRLEGKNLEKEPIPKKIQNQTQDKTSDQKSDKTQDKSQNLSQDQSKQQPKQQSGEKDVSNDNKQKEGSHE